MARARARKRVISRNSGGRYVHRMAAGRGSSWLGGGFLGSLFGKPYRRIKRRKR